jgi:Eco29kI-like restriction endonuclease
MPAQPSRLEELAAELKALSEQLTKEKTPELSAHRLRRVRSAITDAYFGIKKLIDDLDPVKHPGFVFDPSNPNIVGRFVGITLVAQPRKPLINVERFYGSGVYALYYKGDFPAYQQITRKEHPIYVGKADPIDQSSKTAIEQGDRLSARLTEHRRTISKATTTLSIEDFEYRALVVQTGWQASAEDYLIHLFAPIWNNEVGICYGFGKHGDAPETRANLRSPWDTLHPGRDWAHRDASMKDARSIERIVADLTSHFEESPPLTSVDQILRLFLDEMRAAS